MAADPTEVTNILVRMGRGASNRDDRDRLLELLYPELRRIASSLMQREARAITLQPTMLVHEAYVRLVQPDAVDWGDRAHFLAVAARCMRNVLVDAARARHAEKRGGVAAPITLNEELSGRQSTELETLVLHNALERFAELDERAAQVAEMRLFGGMTVEEVARALGVSQRTVDGDWRSARLWLSREFKTS
ncbi:MAG: ECF-type sigma factor [Myxococcota bacterium]